jgi:hypothetical protein
MGVLSRNLSNFLNQLIFMKNFIFLTILVFCSLGLNSSIFATVEKVANNQKKYQTVDSLPNQPKEFFIEVTGGNPKKSGVVITDLQDSLEALRFENQLLKNKLKRCMEVSKK